MLMEKYPKYKDAAEMHKSCLMYAHSYSATMVLRVLEEQPDFFEDKEITQLEFQAHL